MAQDQQSQQTLELRARCEPGPFRVEVGGSDGVTQVFELGMGRSVVIGTGPDAGLRLADRTVSGRHCELHADEHGVAVADLGSRNGLFVGGARVSLARLDGGGASFVIGRSTVTIRPAADAPPTLASPLPGVVGSSDPMRRIADE